MSQWYKQQLDNTAAESLQRTHNRAVLSDEVAAFVVRNPRTPLQTFLAIFRPHGSAQDAEDALQIFLHRRLPRIAQVYNPERGPFSPYFSGSLRRFGLAYRKALATRAENHDPGVDPGTFADTRPSAEHLRITAEMRALLADGIASTLTSRERDVIERFCQDLNANEIAEQLNINRSAVEVRKHRAVLKLRAFIRRRLRKAS